MISNFRTSIKPICQNAGVKRDVNVEQIPSALHKLSGHLQAIKIHTIVTLMNDSQQLISVTLTFGILF